MSRSPCALKVERLENREVMAGNLTVTVFGSTVFVREAAGHVGESSVLAIQPTANGGIHNKMRNETAMTSLSILALGSLGHQPADPTPEGLAMKKALAYILLPASQEADGYFGKTDGSRIENVDLLVDPENAADQIRRQGRYLKRRCPPIPRECGGGER